MIDFALHTDETAPEGSRPALREIKQAFGMVPNVFAVMAESPALLNGAMGLEQALGEHGRFDRTEREIVEMATNIENNCTYCVAAHSAAASMEGVPGEVIEALRAGRPLAEPKLEALRDLARNLVETRGWPLPEKIDAFLAAGYAKGQLLEIVALVAGKVMTNYANHLAHTPLDIAFEAARWEPPKAAG